MLILLNLSIEFPGSWKTRFSLLRVSHFCLFFVFFLQLRVWVCFKSLSATDIGGNIYVCMQNLEDPDSIDEIMFCNSSSLQHLPESIELYYGNL